MGKANRSKTSELRVSATNSSNPRKPRRQRLALAFISLGVLAIVSVATIAWLNNRANAIKTELEAATQLLPSLKEEVQGAKTQEVSNTVEQIRAHTAAAKKSAGDPLWTLASAIPGVGANFSAVTEVARTADDVANLALAPLGGVLQSLNWDSLVPSSSGTDLEPLADVSPRVQAAAHAVRASAERLERIDTRGLLPQVADPLVEARDQLNEVKGALDAAADASHLLPAMLGLDGPRSYLLMIQNNAEARASGGIPGALAVLNLEEGKLTLGAQSSASAVGVTAPTLPIDPEQQQIYSGRIGKFLQDVNLTPNFPTAASTAQAMWEKKTGQRVDGVISIDPVALSYILEATGPVKLDNSQLISLPPGLPAELNGQNIVQTLLSDVYAEIQQPEQQDAYFAGVAKEIFAALSDGRSNAEGLIEGIARGTSEGRVLVWSGLTTEQSTIAKYSLSGSIAGPSVSPAQFGVYFNDGTGAKMDYYVKRTVQLVKECTQDGYEQTTVRITSTNTAPADSATSLPPYVTGAGNFGVPPGSVQTNIAAYGPAQANVELAKLDGEKTEFAPYFHSSRPVGILAVRLAPGQTRTVEFTFGKIVQHTEPHLVVTPTVQDVKDVILPTKNAQCG